MTMVSADAGLTITGVATTSVAEGAIGSEDEAACACATAVDCR